MLTVCSALYIISFILHHNHVVQIPLLFPLERWANKGPTSHSQQVAEPRLQPAVWLSNLAATIMLLCFFWFVIGRCVCFCKRSEIGNVTKNKNSRAPSFREIVWHQNCVFGFLPLPWFSLLLPCWDIPRRELALGIWNPNLRNGTPWLYLVLFYTNCITWSPQQSSEAHGNAVFFPDFIGEETRHKAAQ